MDVIPTHSLSVVLPAFNEEANIAATVEAAVSCLQPLGITWEIIVVNDGSSDSTRSVTEGLIQLYPTNLRLVSHEKNLGYGAALKSGFQAASHDLVFFTDSDGQFDFGQLEEFIAAIEGNDMVIGFRKDRMDPWFRKLNSKTGNRLARWLLSVRVKDINCAYKLFRRDKLQRLPLQSDGALINTEVLAFATNESWKFREIAVRHYPRKLGKPTGANFGVILKTFQEYFALRKRIQSSAVR